jgi:predicted alpha/beta-hydrolase family hydrolase
MLFLQGTRDPFGSPDEMQALVARLPHAALSLVEGGDHSLVLSRARGASGAPDDLMHTTADWMRSLARGPR